LTRHVARRAAGDIWHRADAAQAGAVARAADERPAVTSRRCQNAAALDGAGRHVRDPAGARIAQLRLRRIFGRFDDTVADGLGAARRVGPEDVRSEEHTSELQSRETLVCRLLLEK